MFLRSLRNRNYRLFLVGQALSLIGTWMQIIAASWLIYRLSDSAVMLGVFALVLNFPSFIISPLAGVAADCFDRRKLLVLTNSLLALQAVAMWALVAVGYVQVWPVMVLALVQGILSAFELPVRQSLISHLIDDHKDLPNAVALNSSVINGSRLIGPAIAGLTISFFGEGACFLLNAVSFIPVVITLLMMRLVIKDQVRHPVSLAGAVSGLKEGLTYIYRFEPIRVLLIIVSVLSMSSGAYTSLAPVFVKTVYGGGPRLLGFLLAAGGGGALLGAVYLAGRTTVIGLGRVVAVTGMATGVSYLYFSVQTDFLFAQGMAFLNGLFMITTIAGMNVIIQTLVEERMRGRVMSIYSVALVGMSPLGSLAGGWLSHRVDAVTAVYASGVIIMFVMAWFWTHLPRFRSQVRPVYASKGIMAEMG